MSDLAGRSSHMDFNYLQRVKVYRLNDEGKWDDKGTGHVSVEYLEDSEPISYGNAIGHIHSLARWQNPETQRSDAVGLVVIDEDDNQTLLVHRISADDIYRRQEDTIISWTDPEVATDLALSFQETMGCSFIWDQICSVQRSIHFPSVGGLEGNARPVGDVLEHSGTSQDDGGGAEVLELPPVELSTLLQIAKSIAEVLPFDRDRVASMVVRDQSYIRKLVQLFRTCEDLENGEGLRLMFKIVKGIISLNDGNIFDIIFSDEYIMDIVGALEYDPDLTTCQDHRTFLKEQVIFKEAVPIHDPGILSKIHQTYRIGYIKDVILPRVLDDQTFATINSIMLFNNVSVVSSLQNDTTFLSDLFSRLRAPDTPEENRRDLVFFVQEFCNLGKHLQPSPRSQLFSALVKEGLFDIVKDILRDADEGIRLSGCDILIVALNHDPALLRTFLVHQPSRTLFNELVEGMLTHSKGGLQAQLLEIMRMLLDSETMDTPQIDKSMFLEIFYEKYMDQLVQVLMDGCPTEPGSAESLKDSPDDAGKLMKPTVSPEILGNICELMCFCVQHHRFRIKYYVMRNHVVEKVLKLTRRKEKYLVVAAVRFLRTCISLKDEFYYRYIVKHNCFEPIIGAFVANGNRYNLLNSAVLELIDFIRKEGIKGLIVCLMEKYSSKLESIDYVDTFRALKLKYEQLLEVPPLSTRDTGGAVGSDHGSRSMRDRHSHTRLPDSRKRKDERALDKDEEDYFNEDSDEEEDTATARVSTSSSPQSTKAVLINGTALGDVPFSGSAFGLVDYEDEDENMPAVLGINGGKDKGGVFDKKACNSLPAIPLTDPIWPDVEDMTLAKRKTPLAPSSEQSDATAMKRQRPDESQANEHSGGNQAASSPGAAEVNDSQGLGPPVAGAKALGPANSGRDLPAASTAPAPDNNAKVHPLEDAIPASPLRTTEAAPAAKPQDSDTGLHPFSGSEVHTRTARSSQSSFEAVNVGVAEPSDRDVEMAPTSSNTPLVSTDAGMSHNWPPEEAVAPAKPDSLAGGEAPAALLGLREDGNTHNDATAIPASAAAGVNGSRGGHSKLGDVDRAAASNNGGGGCGSEDRNGSAEGASSERGVGHSGLPPIASKGSGGGGGGSSGVTQQHNGSLDSSEGGNKLASLGTDLMRAVAPTSPGPYTVR